MISPAALVCALDGHYTLGPTGDSIVCLRCGKTLDGLGLDPDLDSSQR